MFELTVFEQKSKFQNFEKLGEYIIKLILKKLKCYQLRM